MSRCFPYPPPGYTLSRASQEALIESIKLQKGKEKSEEHRQKKREKKEKKKEKKEHRKEKKDKKEKRKEKKDKKKSDKHIVQKILPDTKGEFFQKGCEPESEQLEKSSVTEEHGKPVCLRAPSSSSDSTENSNKRKRDSSPIDSSRSHGNIIRIRLSSKKQKQNLPDASANECSTSGRTPVPSHNKDDIAHRQKSGNFCSTSAGTDCKAEALPFTINREQTSEKIETVPAAAKTSIPPVVAYAAAITPIQKEALQYNNLIQNWVPQFWGASLDGDDESDWLFKGRSQERRITEKRSLSVNESVSCSSSSTLWPTAQYLREADVYAMPYTIPF